jgi:hypothetical protein
MSLNLSGRCECGAVAFEIKDARETVHFCHCSQCRRTSGHTWAATKAKLDDIDFSKDDGLTWYTSSAWAERGFCNQCGSSLFYRMNGSPAVGISAGCIDEPHGLKPGKHIFTVDKGSYYEIAKDAPHIEKY